MLLPRNRAQRISSVTAIPKGNYSRDRKRRKAERVSGQKRKPKKEQRGQAVKEEVIQTFAERTLNLLKIPFVHIPACVYRATFKSGYLSLNEKRLAAEYIEGVVDLLIFFPDGRYVVVELKRKGGTVRKEQKEFMRRIGVEHSRLCYSIDEFLDVLKEYGYIVDENLGKKSRSMD